MRTIQPRDLESSALRLAARFPVVGIVGPRQVGKTTLAKTALKGSDGREFRVFFFNNGYRFAKRRTGVGKA